MTKHARTLREELPDLLGADHPALSINEIALALGRNAGAVGNLIRKLNQQSEKVLYVADWRRSKGCHIALWKLGNLPDAKPLDNLTNAEVCQRYKNTANGKKVHNRGCRRWYRQNGGAELRRAWRQNKETIAAFSKHGVSAIDPLLADIMGIPA